MKKLTLLIPLILGALSIQLFAQQINSNITSSYYLANPKGYLSKLDNTIIPSNVLLDRAMPTSPIADYSGSGTVLTGTFTEWSSIFFEQMNGTAGGYTMDAWLAQEKAYLHRVRDEEIVPIIIQNMKYAKVSTQAITSGLLYEQDSFLIEKETYKNAIANANDNQRKQLIANLYTTHRTFAASTVYGRIHGNSITFALDSNFYFSNIKDEIIESVEIDFGNGTGYQYVEWNTPITVAYTGASAFIECAVKFSIIDNTNTPQTLYAHFTVLRTGDDVVPSLEAEATTNGRASINPGERFYFPNGPTGVYETDAYKDGERQLLPNWVMDYLTDNYMQGEVLGQATAIREICVYYDDWGNCEIEENEYYDISGMYYLRIWKPNNASLEVSILYATNNTSGKLRKPLLMVDGFDPGNTRDYYSTNCSGDCDKRGLYEVMNGDLHYFYEEAETSGTIQALRDENYDLVFVDFLVGDDTISTNGERVINLLNYINGANYRDEYTEELVVVGPSMGGLISRYALKTMESKTNPLTPHYVRQWISFDSPQEGANIPMALQRTMQIMYDNDRIVSQSSQPGDALNTLNTPAARQMLLEHYNNNTADLTNFYNAMHSLGYPEQCEKIAISNGSTGELYPTNDLHYVLGTKNIYGTLIVKFDHFLAGSHIVGVKLKDQASSYRITIGKKKFLFIDKNYLYDESSTFSLDNMPGGITNELQKLNFNPDNGAGLNSGLPQYNLSTFIPMLSAFGVPLTRYNIDNWNAAILTSPFDKTYSMLFNDSGLKSSAGLYGGNQFHITITPETKDNVLGEMETNKSIIQVPFVHSSVTSRTQSISGKVAYNGTESVTFCKINGNDKLILEPSAMVTATAPTSITFNTGFHAKAGASFSAKIVNNNGGRIASSIVSPTTPINYAKTSIFSNNKHAYSSLVENNTLLHNSENGTTLIFSVFPTISSGIYKVANKALEEYSVEVINSIGQSIVASTPNLKIIDITNQNSGLYFVRILSNNKSHLFKILKK